MKIPAWLVPVLDEMRSRERQLIDRVDALEDEVLRLRHGRGPETIENFSEGDAVLFNGRKVDLEMDTSRDCLPRGKILYFEHQPNLRPTPYKAVVEFDREIYPQASLVHPVHLSHLEKLDDGKEAQDDR